MGKEVWRPWHFCLNFIRHPPGFKLQSGRESCLLDNPKDKANPGPDPWGWEQEKAPSEASPSPASGGYGGGSRFSAGDFFRPSFQSSLFAPGQQLAGRYEIVQMLGQGGMGAVYRAHDMEVQRDVALKVIRPELVGNPALLMRFKQELILAREVTHPNVVRIYDIGEADGTKFITMEYVDGQDLDRLRTDGGPLAFDQAAEIMSQVCEGLKAVHAHGIVHRDLKPGNIMRNHNGQVVLMDFGLARSADSGNMTQSGALIGTMQYMSPEQALAQPVDARSDIYTVGLIFYELLTGKVPFAADSSLASLITRTQQKPATAVTVAPGLPKAYSEICDRCLEVSPDKRYQSVDELIADLNAARGIGQGSERAVMQKVHRRMMRHYVAIASIAAVVLAVAGFMLFRRGPLKPVAEHPPVSVLVADFANKTGDGVFDGTLEPMVNVALEGAKFINAFSRQDARKLAKANGSDQLDLKAAQLVAHSQSVDWVTTGEISREGGKYVMKLQAIDSQTGEVKAQAEEKANSKDEVLTKVPKLAAPIRKALGDQTPESTQLNEVSGAFTSSSLEAVHLDAVGDEQQLAGKFEEAYESFRKATELDPKFARAYTGMAAMAIELHHPADAQKWAKMAMDYKDRMTEREQYRDRGLFDAMQNDWQKCVDENTELVSKYPADRIGQLNLSSCAAQMRDFKKAVPAARKAVELVPKGVMQHLNLAFLSIASGDFATGEKEARAAMGLNASSDVAYLNLAEAQLGQEQLPQAAETYGKLQRLGASGASLATLGLADLNFYQGKFDEAAKLLESGAAADLAAKDGDAAASKFAALANVQLYRQQKAAAIAAADKALANSQTVSTRFLAALVLAEEGETAKAQKLAAGLGNELAAEPQAYGKIVQGVLELKHGDAKAAIRSISEARPLLDTWIGHFELGRAYLAAGSFIDADGEFDRCIKRRGEAMELFMDDVPTYGFFPFVSYYQGRVREGMKNPEAASSFKSYLNIRGQGSGDPLLAEVKQKLGGK